MEQFVQELQTSKTFAPFLRYSDIPAIRAQVGQALDAYGKAMGVAAGEETDIMVISYNTVARGAADLEITDQTGTVAHATAEFNGPVFGGVQGRYEARFTLIRTSDEEGAFWKITSLDNAADVVRVYFDGK